jgi:septal ring factor EnvC (AmiA/AmiB activator)
VTLFLLWPQGPWAASIESNREELRRIQNTLSEKKKERLRVDQKAQELAEEVKRMSRELDLARQSIKKTQTRLEKTQGNRKDAETSAKQAQGQMIQGKKVVSDDLRRYYERWIAAEIHQPVQLVYHQSLMKQHLSSLSSDIRHRATIEEKRNDLVQEEKELIIDRKRGKEDEAQVQTAKTEISDLYKMTRNEQTHLRKEIQNLQASAKKFEGLIDRLIRQQKEAQKARTFAGMKTRLIKKQLVVSTLKKGRLPWPIEGTVVEGYGKSKHPELNTYIFSNGLKIQPWATGPVKAVDKGDVIYVGEFRNYGQMVLVSHGGDFHGVYAHLGKLNVSLGQKVLAGDVLGVSGKDGAGQSLVYFEWRAAGQAVDPLQWLQR